MYFEVNVSRGKFHLFATSPRSIQTGSTLLDVYTEINTRFPESEGYKVTVTRYAEEGTVINMKEYIAQY